MDDYLQYMKTLRSQINDVEDQASKTSVEEQMQITTIQTLQNDLDFAYADIKRIKGETDEMVLAKGQICLQILEKQRKIASLESDSSTLSQTLELVQQEVLSLSAKFMEKSSYYVTVTEAVYGKLQEQQDWLNSYKRRSTAGQDKMIKDKSGERAGEAEGMFDARRVSVEQNMDNGLENLVSRLESAKTQLEMVSTAKSKLVSDTAEVKQSLEQVKSRIGDFKPEIQAMDIQMLEEYNQALLSDSAGETEYLQSLQQQIERVKGISDVVKCSCGVGYKVGVILGMQDTQ